MKRILALSCIFLCSLTTSAQNRGLNFDGVDDYVTSQLAEPPNFMTVEAWFNPSAGAGAYQAMIYGGQYSYSIWNYGGTWAAGTTLHVELYTVGFVSAVVSYVLPSSLAGNWHHVAFTYNGAALIVYLDGAEVGQAPLTGALPVYGGGYLVLSETNYPYKGTLDELRIWDIARTQAQIQSTMFSEIPANTAGLVSYYKFNQGTIGGNNAGITTLTDAVATARDGSLANFALTGPTSNWVAGYPSLVVLPLRLIAFTAEKQGGGIALQWKTAVQKDISFFEVERSADGRNFAKIGSVNAQRSGVQEPNYTFSDVRPVQDVNHYRLKAIENLGRTSYSNVLLVRMNTITRSGLYPNPATDVLHLQTTQRGKFTVLIRDVSQRVVKTVELTSTGGSLTTTIDVSSFPKGVYFIYVGEEVIRFSKQ